MSCLSHVLFRSLYRSRFHDSHQVSVSRPLPPLTESCLPGTVSRPITRVSTVIPRAGTGGGVADKSITKPEQDKRLGTSRRRPPIYKVLLHNDNFNSRQYVVRVLVKVVDCLSLDEAVNVMQLAHETGIALVTACAQEEAEVYCQGLRNNGLTSTIEPDGGAGGGNSEKVHCVICQQRFFNVMQFSIRQIPKLRRFANSRLTTMAQELKPEALAESKRALRASLRTLLRNLNSTEMDEQSSKIALNVMESPMFQRARNVGLYIQCPKLNEVNTSWIVAEALNQG
eukprot:g1442.t1